MSQLRNEKYIRSQVRRIISEEEEKPKPEPKKEEKPKKSKATFYGGPGSGDVAGLLKDIFGGTGVKSLANTNAGKLMKNLNVSSISGKSAIDKIENLFKSAIGGTSEMGAVFGGIKPKTDSGGRRGVFVDAPGLPKARDGAFFLKETIKGAVNSGMLSLDSSIRMGVMDGGTMVYSVSGSGDRWNEQEHE
jgi:hypothetical protein